MATNKLLKKCSLSSFFFIRYASSYRHVVVEDQGPVRIVTINRPENRNCVNSQTANELYDAFNKFEQDESSLVGILAGKGGTFCAGYDLKEVSSANERLDVLLKPFSMDEKGPMGPSRLLLTKPVIASLTGYAVAGGMELALWCDLRVAEEGAKIGVFCRRFGVPLIDGGTIRLPALIGLSRALDLILTGREVDAKEGFDIGLINRIVPDGEALNEALKLANQIAAFPQACLRKDRYSSIHSTHSSLSLNESLRYEYEQGTEWDVIKEAIRNAGRFVDGVGKSGKFE